MKTFLRHITLLISLCCIVNVHAEGFKCPMHENVLTLTYGGIWQNDEYLSPLLYSGQAISIQQEWWTSFLNNNPNNDWEHVGKVHVSAAITDNNRAILNRQYVLGVDGGWGAHYSFQRLIDVKGLNVFVGPYLHFDLMGRNITSYENKPYSMDLSANLRAHAGVSYTIHAPKTAYRFQYTIMTDLAGAMFAPDYWQSYYEMNQSLQGTIVGSSVHNRQTLMHELSIDLQFRRSTWRVGVRHEYLQYKANNLHFSREQVCLVIGTVFNHQLSKTAL